MKPKGKEFHIISQSQTRLLGVGLGDHNKLNNIFLFVCLFVYYMCVCVCYSACANYSHTHTRMHACMHAHIHQSISFGEKLCFKCGFKGGG